MQTASTKKCGKSNRAKGNLNQVDRLRVLSAAARYHPRVTPESGAVSITKTTSAPCVPNNDRRSLHSPILTHASTSRSLFPGRYIQPKRKSHVDCIDLPTYNNAILRLTRHAGSDLFLLHATLTGRPEVSRKLGRSSPESSRSFSVAIRQQGLASILFPVGDRPTKGFFRWHPVLCWNVARPQLRPSPAAPQAGKPAASRLARRPPPIGAFCPVAKSNSKSAPAASRSIVVAKTKSLAARCRISAACSATDSAASAAARMASAAASATSPVVPASVSTPRTAAASPASPATRPAARFSNRAAIASPPAARAVAAATSRSTTRRSAAAPAKSNATSKRPMDELVRTSPGAKAPELVSFCASAPHPNKKPPPAGHDASAAPRRGDRRFHPSARFGQFSGVAPAPGCCNSTTDAYS